MSDLILPPEFWTRPNLVVRQSAAMERLIARYEEQLALQVKVLAALAVHASELARGKKVGLTPGGFTFPFKWQSDIPAVCDLNIVDDHEAGQIVVRVADPSARPGKVDDTGWVVPDEQKKMEDDLLA